MPQPIKLLQLLLFFLLIPMLMVTSSSCSERTGPESGFTGAENEIRIMTLNPGHFHAALVQLNRIKQLDSAVYIFTPGGNDLNLHIQRIEGFNSRADNPTDWELEIYTGPDYLERMITERPGNVMVTAGNNRLKTDYILRSVDEGIHVLSDKPMAIDTEGWEKLRRAFQTAEDNGVLLYDIMTERYEVTSRIQRILAQNRELFGELETGSPEQPAIVKESVHHLFKTVAGSTLRRPPWYFDVNQQGEGIVDVTTHLVDLSLWGSFPDEAVFHEQDIDMLNARRWPTMLTRQEFERITGEPDFPGYLQGQLENGTLPYYCNGAIHYTIRGHHVHVSVQWDYEAPPGGNDSHFSLMRGSKTNLVIRQGAEQSYKSTLYVEPVDGVLLSEIETALANAVEALQAEFPGTTYTQSENGWVLAIPDEFYLGHEAHFGKVAEAYFGYLVDGKLPGWEVPNMITKYYITTRARELALNEN